MGHRRDQERHQSHHDEDERTIRHELYGSENSECNRGSRAISGKDGPIDIGAPEKCPPPVRGCLRDAMEDHGGRNGHQHQQKTHQDHAARHSENAGKERGAEDDQPDDENKSWRHDRAVDPVHDRCVPERSQTCRVATDDGTGITQSTGGSQFAFRFSPPRAGPVRRYPFRFPPAQ
jgi:hypothetical protein